MPKWEYAIVTREQSGKATSVKIGAQRARRVADRGVLNDALSAVTRLGRDGWELCGVEALEHLTSYWLKRAIAD